MSKFDVNIHCGCDNSVLPLIDVVNSVRTHDMGEDSTGTPLYKRQSDIYLLFHQEKLLERLGVDTLRDWFSSLTSQSSAIDYSQFSDDQLLKFVKSRHLQSPTELLSWSTYLNDMASGLRKSFDDYVANLTAHQNATDNTPKAE